MTMASGVFGVFLNDMGDNDKAFDLTADTLKWEIVSDSYTPDFNVHDEEADITNEVTGTGYTTGGEAVVGNTWAAASGFATLDHNDISLSNTTLSSIKGLVHFDDTLAGDPLISALNLPSTYNTSSGTFAVTLDANGLWRIDYIP